MNKPPGGSHITTTITVLNSAGVPWAEARIEHNEKILSTDIKGRVYMILNGGAVRINGVPVTRKIQKEKENIFRYSTKTGNFTKEDTSKDSDNILPLLA